MPSQIGHITRIYEDGTCEAQNDLTGERWNGRITIGSGGMFIFTLVDERMSPMGSTPIYPEQGEAPVEARVEAPNKQRVRVGPRKPAVVVEDQG